jgi:hypothetical protein
VDWGGDKFSDTVNQFCKSFLFPKYKFLKEGWPDYQPYRKNGLYLLCMRNLKIPEGPKAENIWERVIVLLIRMKYINIKGNMNNNIKKIYESMIVVLHTSFINNYFFLTDYLTSHSPHHNNTHNAKSVLPDELAEGIEECMNSNTLHVVYEFMTMYVQRIYPPDAE